MQSKATTVAQYLRELPADRRAAIEAVRAVILAGSSSKSLGVARGFLRRRDWRTHLQKAQHPTHRELLPL